MVLRNIGFTLFFTAVCLCLGAAPAAAFRCGGRLVELDQTTLDVLDRCGRPDHVDYWEEGSAATHFARWYDYEKDRYMAPESAKGPLRLERWTYDLGPNKFIRYLLFENGRLVKIETGEKGRRDRP